MIGLLNGEPIEAKPADGPMMPERRERVRRYLERNAGWLMMIPNPFTLPIVVMAEKEGG